MKNGDNLVYKEDRMKVVGICNDVVFAVKVNKDGSTTPPEFFLINDLLTWGWKVDNQDLKSELIETFEQVYEIDGVSTNNTLFVIEKVFLSEGWSLHDAIEARELLRPLIIYLNRHKELCEKEHFKKGVSFGKELNHEK